MSRRAARWISAALVPLILVMAGTVFFSGRSSAQRQRIVPEAVSPSTRAAIQKALDFLKSAQNQDGSFGDSYHVANSALAGLAFLGSGNTYNRGPYTTQIRKVLQYILDRQDRWGFIDDHQCRMHGHGYATLFLAETHGMLPPERQKHVYKALRKACRVILDSQTFRGGWDYYPSHTVGSRAQLADEGSITVTVVQALRAARNAGLNIPKASIDKGLKYMQECMTPDGCKYRYTDGSSWKSYALTAAAVSVLNASGVYESKALDMGLAFMRKRIAEVDVPLKASKWPWYGNLYAAQALWQTGGTDWENFYRKSFPYLVNTQAANGSWDGSRGGWGSGYGDVFATSIAALMLEIPLAYLPIFER
jgi:squalene cyclase